ncbi:hypothetical protein HPB49_019395 [Dermacentor silvarum]|uniref:Uncharacterized protein n=1 Tax=Dermacentor silvarum TaxID=543639 RepID=A0ACB8CGT5_DERSI|nr:hypothetical protein HPB49_019395 [Dermacentor silvarum]
MQGFHPLRNPQSTAFQLGYSPRVDADGSDARRLRENAKSVPAILIHLHIVTRHALQIIVVFVWTLHLKPLHELKRRLCYGRALATPPYRFKMRGVFVRDISRRVRRFGVSRQPTLPESSAPRSGMSSLCHLDRYPCSASVPNDTANNFLLSLSLSPPHSAQPVHFLLKVNVKARGPNIRGGPLQHDYQLDRLHAHWSKNSETGSEHAVDGKYYAGELHLVHFNAELYKSFSEAAPSEQGLAVLAVFLKEGAPHPQLKGIVDCIPYITYKGMECALQQPLDFVSLIPAGSSYWTYEGSLTTPPWYENVTWIVYKQPIEVSPEQLVVFRKLMSYEERVDPQKSTDGPIDSNVRPIQPLNRRVVREPFGKQPDSVPIS